MKLTPSEARRLYPATALMLLRALARLRMRQSVEQLRMWTR
jgi:hypothetical protein